jgi:hypothetical protein
MYFPFYPRISYIDLYALKLAVASRQKKFSAETKSPTRGGALLVLEEAI